MTAEEGWILLKKIAKQRLSFVDKPMFLESFIEYECEPFFQPVFNLQLIWSEKNLRWRSAEWNMKVDNSKFYELDGQGKVVLLQPEPTVKIKSGTVNHELLKDIITHIRQLKIPLRIDRLKMFTLDGSLNTLSIGVDDLRTTYVWHTLPDEWKELEKIVDMLLDIRKMLQ